MLIQKYNYQPLSRVSEDGKRLYATPDGLEIDYVCQEGFEFNNPLEKNRCGCGESFRI
jgi:iron-sulfur cluster assembly protein